MSVMVVIFRVCCLNRLGKQSRTKTKKTKLNEQETKTSGNKDARKMPQRTWHFLSFCSAFHRKRLEMMRVRAHVAVINSFKYSPKKNLFDIRESVSGTEISPESRCRWREKSIRRNVENVWQFLLALEFGFVLSFYVYFAVRDIFSCFFRRLL